MLDELLDDPRLSEYMTTFKNGQILFLEGDDSHDLYILVSGKLGIFKGNMEITHV
jgi:CRP-like cAMP-binding protein